MLKVDRFDYVARPVRRAGVLSKVWTFVWATLLAGCDIMYGVTHQASLDVAPDPLCVEKVLKSATGVVRVERLTVTQPPVALGAQAVDRNYGFFYRGSEVSRIRAVLQVWTDPNGRIEFHHALQRLNEKVPQDYIDATRPVMQQIEARLVA